VHAALGEVVAQGGRAIGNMTKAEVPGSSKLTFVYAADPEGNIVELQAWG
jgi:predicted enzyme related to lactoylglutathione lyase